MYTVSQTGYNDALLARTTGNALPLMDFADGEHVNAATFNTRQEIYKGLFGYLDDRHRVNVLLGESTLRDLYGDAFVARAFTGTLDSGRVLTFTAGAIYSRGQKFAGLDRSIQLGVVDQVVALVLSTGTLTAFTAAGYTPDSDHLVVGNWNYGTLTYTPAVAQLNFSQNVVFGNGVTFTGDQTAAANFHIQGNLLTDGNANVLGDMVVHGQLILVGGNSTHITTTELEVGTAFIELLADTDAGATPVLDAGVRVNRGNQAYAILAWKESEGRWRTSHGFVSSGNIAIDGAQLNFTGAAGTVASAGTLSLTAAGTVDFFGNKVQMTTAGDITSVVYRYREHDPLVLASVGNLIDLAPRTWHRGRCGGFRCVDGRSFARRETASRWLRPGGHHFF
jgi:hypothetical protein